MNMIFSGLSFGLWAILFQEEVYGVRYSGDRAKHSVLDIKNPNSHLEALCNNQLPEYGSHELFGSGVFSCNSAMSDKGSFGGVSGATFLKELYELSKPKFTLFVDCPRFPNLLNHSLQEFDWSQCSDQIPDFDPAKEHVAIKYSMHEQKDPKVFLEESNSFRGMSSRGHRVDRDGNQYNIFPFILDPKFDDPTKTDMFHSSYFIMQFYHGHVPTKFNEHMTGYSSNLSSITDMDEYLVKRWKYYGTRLDILDFLLQVIPKQLWAHGIAHCDLHSRNIILEDSDELIEGAPCKELIEYNPSKPIGGYTCLAERQVRYIDLAFSIDTKVACKGDPFKLALPCVRCQKYSKRMEDIGEIMKRTFKGIPNERKAVNRYLEKNWIAVEPKHKFQFDEQMKFIDDIELHMLDRSYPPVEQCFRAFDLWTTKNKTKEQQAEMRVINNHPDRDCSLSVQIDLARHFRTKIAELKHKYARQLAGDILPPQSARDMVPPQVADDLPLPAEFNDDIPGNVQDE